MAQIDSEPADWHRRGQAQESSASGPTPTSRPRMFDMFANSRTFSPSSYATLLEARRAQKNAGASNPASSPVDSPQPTPSDTQRPALGSSSSDLPPREPNLRTTLAAPTPPGSAGSLQANRPLGAVNDSVAHSHSSGRANTGRGLQYKRFRPSPIDTTRSPKRLRLQPAPSRAPSGAASEAGASYTRRWGPEETPSSGHPTDVAQGGSNTSSGPLGVGDSNGLRQSRDLGHNNSGTILRYTPRSAPGFVGDATPKWPSPNSSASREVHLGPPKNTADTAAQVRKWPGVKPCGPESLRDVAPSPVRQSAACDRSDEHVPRVAVSVQVRKWPGTSSSDSRVRPGPGSDTNSLGRLGHRKHKEFAQAPGTRECYYCQRRLLIGASYRCSHCSIELCDTCNINASLIHPGYAFREFNGASDGDIEDSGGCVSSITCCHTCRCKLTDTWYECEDCFDTVYSCAGCRRGHDPQHTFRTIVSTGRPRLFEAAEEACNDQGDLRSDGGVLRAAEEGPNGEGGSLGDQGAGDEDSGDEDFGEGPSNNGGDLGDEDASAVAVNADGDHATALANSRDLRRTRRNTLDLSSLLTYDADQDTISFSRDSFVQLSNIVKAAFGLAEKAMGIQSGTTHIPDPARSGQKFDMELLDFDHLDLDIDLDAALEARPSERGSVRLSSARRPWLPEDRVRLRRLKEKGWADERIARELKRTCSAVTQQWRKQRADEL